MATRIKRATIIPILLLSIWDGSTLLSVSNIVRSVPPVAGMRTIMMQYITEWKGMQIKAVKKSGGPEAFSRLQALPQSFCKILGCGRTGHERMPQYRSARPSRQITSCITPPAPPSSMERRTRLMVALLAPVLSRMSR